MSLLHITESNFDSLLEENDFIILDFWSSHCAPCLAFNRIIDANSVTYPDWVFGKINIDDEPALAQEFGVQTIPAVLIIRSQVVVFAESGLLTDKQLKTLIDDAKKLTPTDLS